MGKLVKTRNIWVGLAIFSVLFMALNAMDSHTVWYFTIRGLGLVRVLRRVPVWAYVLPGALNGILAIAAAACTALKGKAAGIVFSVLNLLMALVMTLGAIGSGVAVLTVSMVFWLVVSVLQLFHALLKKGGTAFFVATLVLALASLVISMLLTCMRISNPGSDRYIWLGLRYWTSPNFLNVTIFSGKVYLYAQSSSACAMFPLSRMALMLVAMVGFRRFGKAVEVPDWLPPKKDPSPSERLGSAYESDDLHESSTYRDWNAPDGHETIRRDPPIAPAPYMHTPEKHDPHHPMTMRIDSASDPDAFSPAGRFDASETFSSTVRFDAPAANAAISADAGSPAAPQNDPIEMLRMLAAFRDQGLLTEEEFNQKKAALLSKM